MKFVPRVHNYALKIPWASAEAQYGQAYNAVRTLIVFFLFVTIFYLLPQVTQSLVILRTLSEFGFV